MECTAENAKGIHQYASPCTRSNAKHGVGPPMPVIPSNFQAPWLISNGHVQTILGAVTRREMLAYERERLELPDGDFLDLDWRRSGARRLVIVSHGLEGSSTGSYIALVAQAVSKAGWDALAWNMRGCSGETNRLARSYHSGESNDLRTVINHAASDYDEVALVGFSLGGNVTLKYLGEAPPHAKVIRAACFSVPVDLRASADALDTQWQNRLYLRRFLATMVDKAQIKAQRFPEQVAIVKPGEIRTLREFDDRFTAPLHGFKDAEDYWAKCSSRQFIPRITVPALLVNAQNDSFLTKHSMPYEEARQSETFYLEAPTSGGHVGFLEGLAFPPYYVRRVAEFLSLPQRRLE